MVNLQLHQQLLAEFLGTTLLLAVVCGSGIMGQQLGAGNAAVALLGNSIATGCGLYVLISLLGPISGAHFNPVVSTAAYVAGNLNLQQFVGYLAAQLTGAIAGIWLTHAMFAQAILQTSSHARTGVAQLLSEFLSTLLLLLVIRLGSKNAPEKIAMLVSMTVTAGYWFTSSTFFANPAVTFARSLTDTFVGIAPTDVLGFVVAQVLALAAYLMVLRVSFFKT